MSLIPHGHRSGLFIHGPLNAVADCILAWYKELERTVKVERSAMTLENSWSFLDQGRFFNPNRAMLVPMKDWTAYFDNHSREFVAGAHRRELCRRLKCDTCHFFFDDRTLGMEGSCEFGHVRYESGEVAAKSRQVRVIHDSGWQFEEFGDPLPFEQLERYKLRKKADRLNPEILRDYGAALGVPFWDESAYGDQVVQIEEGSSLGVDSEKSFKQIVEAAKASGVKGKLLWLNSTLGLARPPENL